MLRRQPGNAAETNTSGSTSSAMHALTGIWREIFGRPPLTPDENFFAAGGNPVRAIELSDRLRTEFGKDIPPLALYAAPTPRALARTLTERTPPRLSDALLLKPGSAAPPVFFFHGTGGNVMEFFDVVQHITWPYPIYGLQARGTDGLQSPCGSVEEMAGYHLKAIRKLQAHGPYVLCGYSLGGVVAIETARQLLALGEPIAMVAMIDAYPHQRHLRTAQRCRSYAVRARDRLRRALGDANSSSVCAQRSQELSDKICGSPAPAIKQAARAALRQYSPKPYSGKVRFITAREKTTFPPNPATAWHSLTGEFSVETVPGVHHGMLQTSAATIASLLSGYVAEALDNQSPGAGSVARAG